MPKATTAKRPPRPNPDAPFLLALQPGQLAVVHQLNGSYDYKVHIVELVQRSHHYNAGPPPSGINSWVGKTMCPVLQKNRWMYAVEPRDLGQNRCAHCWKRDGDKTIAGWSSATIDAASDEALVLNLPMGWHQVETVGHPWDVPQDGDIELVLNVKEEVVGVHRTELYRWQRGPCVVRIVLNHDEHRYEVRYFDFEKPFDEGMSAYGINVTAVASRARQIMAMGGRP